MNHHSLAPLTRRAAGLSRRSSLAALGAAGAAAVLGHPLATDAKKKKCSKKLAEQVELCEAQIADQRNVRCATQVAQCQTFIATNQGNAAQLVCCNSLATCDFATFGPCLVAAAQVM